VIFQNISQQAGTRLAISHQGSSLIFTSVDAENLDLNTADVSPGEPDPTQTRPRSVFVTQLK